MNDLSKTTEAITKVGEAAAKMDEAISRLDAAFQRLLERVIKINDDMAFRIKQSLHPSNHEPVDGHAAAAKEALCIAVQDTRANLFPISSEPVMEPVAGDGDQREEENAGTSLEDTSNETAEPKPVQEG